MFPALAGMIPTSAAKKFEDLSVPRISGNDPDAMLAGGASTMCSLHKWGWWFGCAGQGDGAHVFPAQVGMVPSEN